MTLVWNLKKKLSFGYHMIQFKILKLFLHKKNLDVANKLSIQPRKIQIYISFNIIERKSKSKIRISTFWFFQNKTNKKHFPFSFVHDLFFYVVKKNLWCLYVFILF